MLKDDVHIKLLLDSIQRYREGTMDIEGLQQNFSAVMTAIEGNVPAEVRAAVNRLEARIENVRFTVSKSVQHGELENIFQDFELLISSL